MTKKNPFSIPKEYFIQGRKKIRARVEAKYGGGPFSQKEKQGINKEVKRKMQLKLRAKHYYEYMKIQFDRRRVRLYVPKCGHVKMSFRPAQLIQHFRPQEIRRAAEKYVKLKQKLEL